MTMRDDIWNAALEQLVATGKFKSIHIMTNLGLEEAQRQTVRRVLREMEEQGWVERETEQSSIWRLGWKGRHFLNVSEETIEQARA